VKNFYCSRIQNATRPSTAFLNACLLLSTASSTIVCSVYEYKWTCLHSMAAGFSSRLRKTRAHDPHVHFSICLNVQYIVWRHHLRQYCCCHVKFLIREKIFYLESRLRSRPPNSTHVPRECARGRETAILNLSLTQLSLQSFKKNSVRERC
jgi:hypothetical protein